MNSNSKVILGIIAAGVVGVAIGMLLAPKKGSDIRSNIKGGIDEFGDKITDLINDGKDRIKGVADEFKADVNTIKEDAQIVAQHTKQVVS